MLRLRVERARPLEDQLVPAASAIQSGGVVAFPTDTFYGLAVDPRSGAAIRKIFELKERSDTRAIPLIADSITQVTDCVGTLTPLAERLALQYWPGPLTLIIPASAELNAELTGRTGRVAVRVPDHAVARTIARLVGCAITSTSANVSGLPSPSTADEVAATLGSLIDVLVDAGAAPGGLPSTIIDVTAATPVLVRPGAVHWERVLKFLG